MQPIPFSKIIAGTMTWGVWGKKYNTQEMTQLIEGCLAHHITTFDHADIYGDYSTEAEFGAALKTLKIDRTQIQLISKCGIQMENKARETRIKHYNYHHEYIIWSVEQSLKNLQTDYLDLLLLHRPSPLMQADEIAEAITKLKSEGKIKHFGVSNFTPSQTELIESRTKIEVNQIEFSITHYEAMLNGSLDQMTLRNIIPMSWSPLGTVFKKENEQTLRLKKTLTEIAKKHNVGLDIILLAWILKHPAGILPVCGTAEMSRIAQLMQATTIDLALEDWFALWTASAGAPVP